MSPDRIKKFSARNFRISVSWNNILISFGILAATTAMCFFLRRFSYADSYSPMLFQLAVLLISRFTNGYAYGLVSSFLSVICVNYIFTYPYFELNFTYAGYPLTFISMFTTSLITSAMTTQFKKSEKIKTEIKAEKIRGNLLRAVSHDLRTPLTSISGSLQAVIENKNVFTDEQQLLLLREAKDDAQWLIRIVENLLSITRINSSEARLKTSPEAAEEVIGEAIRKFSRRFPDIKIKVSVPDELLMVPMDALLIEQVLENLMENSVLHGKATTLIDVSVRRLSTSALFSVLDDGKGIDEVSMEHLFDGKLVHSGSRDYDNKKNMGIGLSVCMSIVRAHGGNMTAANMPLGGAAFQFTLPLGEDNKNEH